MFSWRKATPETGADRCPDTCFVPLPRPARRSDIPDWDPPPTRPVAAREQALGIVDALQDEGRTGFVPRGVILRRYAEYCWMNGFEPIALNDLCEAFGQVCRRVRRMVDGRKVTGYVIPERGALVVAFARKEGARKYAETRPAGKAKRTWPRVVDQMSAHRGSEGVTRAAA